MNDLKLWKLLHDNEVDQEELANLLTEMQTLPLADRIPYLGLLDPLFKSDLPKMRAAAYSILAGATGYLTWQCLLRGLDDPDPEVQSAAFEAMRVSAEYEPHRWHYVLFHSSANLQQRALSQLPQNFDEPQLVYLLGNTKFLEQICDILRNTIFEPEYIPILLDYCDKGILSQTQVLRWLALLPWKNCKPYIEVLTNKRNVIHQIPTLTQFEEWITSPLLADDDLDRLFLLISEFLESNSQLDGCSNNTTDIIDHNSLADLALNHTKQNSSTSAQLDDARLLNDLRNIFVQIQRSWCNGSFSYNTFSRIVTSIACVGFRQWYWEKDILALCVRIFPAILLHEQIPLDLRKLAASSLTVSNNYPPLMPDLGMLLDGELCRFPSGLLDLPTITGILKLFKQHKYQNLFDYINEEDIINSALAHPELSIDFLCLAVQSKREKRLHSSIIHHLLHPTIKIELSLLASLSLRIPVERLNFLSTMNSWPQQEIEPFIELLFEQIRNNNHSISDHRCESIAKKLYFIFLYQLYAFIRIILNNIIWSYEHLSTTWYNPLAIECIEQIVKNTPFKTLLKHLLALLPNELNKFLDLLQKCPGIPYELEKNICEAFKHNTPLEVNSLNVQAPVPISGICRQRGNIKSIPSDLATQIASCSDQQLGQLMQICYQYRVVGLVNALLKRPQTYPDLEVSAALLICSDPYESVAETFALFSSPEPDFAHQLDKWMVQQCEPIDDLPLLGSIWLFKWQKHCNSFSQKIASFPNGLYGYLIWALELAPGLLSLRIWMAVNSLLSQWRWHKSAKISQSLPDDICDFLVDLLLPPDMRKASQLTPIPAWAEKILTNQIEQEAALMLLNLHRANAFGPQMRAAQDRTQLFLPQISRSILAILRDWLYLEEIPHIGEKKHQFTSVDPDLSKSIRKALVAQELATHCRDQNRLIVEEAASQLLILSNDGLDVLVEVMLEDPPPTHLRSLCETITLWPETHHLLAIAAYISTTPNQAERRFLLASSLYERKQTQWWDIIIESLHSKGEHDWFEYQDWLKLLRIKPDKTRLSIELITSPLSVAYSLALQHILQLKDPLDQSIIEAFESFLQCGNDHPQSSRLNVAQRLQYYGLYTGWPLLLAKVLQSKKTHDGIKECDIEKLHNLFVNVPTSYITTAVRAVLYAGYEHININNLFLCLKKDNLDADSQLQALLEILRYTHITFVQNQALELMQRTPQRSQNLSELADTFAWGVNIARELSGGLFVFKMIVGNDLGYTRLSGREIFINPLPLLRKERNGKQIIHGLILHEIGHHLYHSAKEDVELWEKTNRENKLLANLLNLVADEHLERNLRLKDQSFARSLKTLASYAFQHSERDIPLLNLLQLLGARCFDILHRTSLRPSLKPQNVRLNLGKLFSELEAQGMSFPRFVRALRMGLGNRHSDPLVEQALSLFTRDFRNASMPELLNISKSLYEIFFPELQLMELLSQDGMLKNELSAELHGALEGISDEELQREVERILRSKDQDDTKGQNSHSFREINLSTDIAFPLINSVQTLIYNRSEHAKYSAQISRYSIKLREYLLHLGLGYVYQKHRTRGQKIDRSSLTSSIIKSDPRILVARKTLYKSDLFIAVIIDCSGSMVIHDNIERAKLFATLIADAAANISGVDAHFLGFTDSVLYNAGNAQNCAVHALQAEGGNNDAAALWYASRLAIASRRKARLIVMISDGSPTECSVDALQQLVQKISIKFKICCAQVAVAQMQHICFPHYIELTDSNINVAVQKFGSMLMKIIHRIISG